MRCPACGAANAEERRFCGACGARLVQPCADCGFANEAAARFCGGCGTRLGGREATATPPVAEPAPERRQVTVLFADLAGYTRLTAELGAEETRILLDAFFGTVDGVVTAYGGTVDKHIGDCVMALFGAPVARGDDAGRAVRAALAIRDALPGLAARVGRPLAAHVGIAFGEVVAGDTGSAAHRAYTVTGDSVNLAARLTGLADAGEILVSDSVRLALAERVELADLGPRELRGIAEPVRVHKVLGLAPSPDEAPHAAPGGLVGRRAEVDQLLAVLAEVLAGGTGHVALVRGEPGIGKTRLVGELRRLAPERGFACHAALVLDFGAGEGRDAVRALARRLLSDGGDGAGPRIALPAELEPFLLDLRGEALPPAARAVVDAMDERQRRSARQRAVAAILAGRAAERPLLLVVEDLHWADPGTLDDLAALAEAAAALPVALVLTTRRDGDPIDTAWHARAGMPPFTTVDLGPLRQADARVLAGRLLADGVGETVERCLERAQGNPLFLEQLLRHARERRDEAVPGTVHSLVQARLDSLDRGSREALRAAAVLGQRWALPALRALLGEPAFEPGVLVRRFLVRPLGGEEYLFAHALIRDAVYDSLLRSRLRDLHRRAAAWYADHDDPVLHAQHLERAEDAGAPAAYAAAAEAQARAYRAEAALALAEHGLRLAREPSDRFRLSCLLGRVRLDLGRAEPALDAYGGAAGLAADDGERCEAWLGLAAAMRLRDRIPDALDLLGRAEEAAGRLQDHVRLVRVHHLRGNLMFPLGRVDDCAREHARALALAERTGSPELLAQALGGMGDAAYAQGRYRTALASFARCVALAAEHGLGRIEVANRGMIPCSRAFAGPLHGALEEAEAAIEAAARVGHRRAEIIARHAAAFTLVWQLRPDAAAGHIEQAERLTAEIGAHRFRAENTAIRAGIARVAGKRSEAARLAAEALPDAEATAPHYLGPLVAGICAEVALDAAAREGALAVGERLLAGTSLKHNHLFFRQGAVEALLDAGDWDRAAAHADRLAEEFAAEPLPFVELLVARGRALAAWGRGDRSPEAANRLGDLAAEAEALGYLGLVSRLREAAHSSGRPRLIRGGHVPS